MSKGPFSSTNFLVLSTSEIFISRHFVFHPFKFISSETSVRVTNLREAIVTNAPLEAKAQGGPVQQGKPYVVGEQGPEIIIPRSDGDVLTNDDSQIYAMLLASNPQLQKVSRQRAEKIMRNRFPEYFEG